MSVFNELKRRNVFRVAAAYLAGAWLLIQLVNEIFPLFGISDAAGRLVVIVLSIGFVPTLIVSWVFELTPEGLKRDAGGRAPTRSDEHSVRRFDRAIMVVLALALVVFSVDRFLLQPAREAELVESTVQQALTDARLQSFGDKSIAVLPFTDLSEAGDQEYFSDGISEELLNLLAKIPELRVAGRTSAFSFKGKDATIAEIAETLNVDHVLEGSVRRSGDRLRITAQLIDARADAHLWSETYDREMGDVFAIQDEIAAQVVDKLRITLLEPALTVDETMPEAYALYLQAKHINRSGLGDSLPRALDMLQRVIKDDPNYFPARSMLAETYNNMGQTGALSPQESQRLLRRTIDEAALIWPDRPELDAWRAWMEFAFPLDQDLELAARYYERAQSKDPTLVPFSGFGLALNRPELAIEIAEYELARDPICYGCYQALLSAYLRSERYDDLEEAYLAARALNLNGPDLAAIYGDSLLLRGEADRALAVFESLTQRPVRRLSGIAMALHDLGRTREFDTTFGELKALAGDRVSAGVYAYIGELDAAFEILNAQPSFPLGAFDGPMRVMSEHPRWTELAEKAGIWPDDPREDIDFEVHLPQ